jgi:hypothetical protein
LAPAARPKHALNCWQSVSVRLWPFPSEEGKR